MTTHSNSEQNTICVIITAAGSSTRMGGSVKKEYLPLGEGTVLSSSVKAFEEASKNPEHPFTISHLIITVPAVPSGKQDASRAVEPFVNLPAPPVYVTGSDTRQKSILNALEYVAQSGDLPKYVLIHDGARPFISPEVIQNVIFGTIECGAAAPGINPTDTIKEIDQDGFIVKHLERSQLTAIQTPQGFVFEKLYDAHKKAAADSREYTDDSEIWGKYVGPVKLVEGNPKNIKITYAQDLRRAL